MRRVVLAVAGAAMAAVLAVTAGCRSGDGRVSGSGTLEATEVRVASEVGGRILEFPAREGDTMRAGQLVARLDDTDLRLARDQARAAADLARAQLDLTLSGAREEDITQALEGLAQAEENARRANEDQARMRELFAAGSVTQKQRDDADARATVVAAQVRAARAALEKLRTLARPEEVRAARARLDQAEAALRAAERRVAETRVTAPAPGTVSKRLAEPGEVVAPGFPLATVVDLSVVRLVVYVPEPALPRMRVGADASVTVDGLPGRSFAGKVSFISPEAEFTPRNVQTKEERVKLVFAVKIELPNPDGLLKPGMPADALIVGAQP
jgi:HlyD family secretion protein